MPTVEELLAKIRQLEEEIRQLRRSEREWTQKFATIDAILKRKA